MLANSPPFLVHLCFSTYTLLFLQSCVCWKLYKNSVFSGPQLLCITDSKAPSRGPSPKWHFWNQKCHFGFSPVPAETPIFVVFGDCVWSQKKWHSDSVNENARFFAFRAQKGFAYLSHKCHSCKRKTFCSQPPNKLFQLYKIVLFRFYSSILFFFLRHKKDKNKKLHCFFFEQKMHCFSNTLFWHPDKHQKTIRTPTPLLVILKMPPNTLKLEKKTRKQNHGPSVDAT